ncbi:hypothetical protein M9H77_33933 [Catharanthus roseus]|uniref:Uncharacterized protein n=1 Tax=Catharanthus roseus TaxID=4058 RepID=A0ACB9ZK41_CATRO|nr:hypothetical protein M9H77_33933 [Catharanthus roseus]
MDREAIENEDREENASSPPDLQSPALAPAPTPSSPLSVVAVTGQSILSGQLQSKLFCSSVAQLTIPARAPLSSAVPHALISSRLTPAIVRVPQTPVRPTVVLFVSSPNLRIEPLLPSTSATIQSFFPDLSSIATFLLFTLANSIPSSQDEIKAGCMLQTGTPSPFKGKKRAEEMKTKNYRKRGFVEETEDSTVDEKNDIDDDQERRLTLEEVKFLQKQREKKSGIPAIPITAKPGGISNNSASGLIRKGNEKIEGDGEKDDLVLQDTFAQETAVMVEDPNMLRYIEQELAKKRGRNLDTENQVENDVKRAEDELYKIPEHLKVRRRNSEESSTQWTTGIAEVQLPMEYKLRNIEETEAAKKLLQEKRLMGRTKTESSIPSSYSADYFQRGKDYAEKLRREHPELYKDKELKESSSESKASDYPGKEAAVQRQAATDEFMLERFRRRERHRVMRR